MDVLAHAADYLGMKQFSQFVGEIHCCWRLPIITVIPSTVERSRCEIFRVTSSVSRLGTRANHPEERDRSRVSNLVLQVQHKNVDSLLSGRAPGAGEWSDARSRSARN